MAQMVEHILGKDEVTGSIPVISSIKNTSKLACVFLFYDILYGISTAQTILPWSNACNFLEKYRHPRN